MQKPGCWRDLNIHVMYHHRSLNEKCFNPIATTNWRLEVIDWGNDNFCCCLQWLWCEALPNQLRREIPEERLVLREVISTISQIATQSRKVDSIFPYCCLKCCETLGKLVERRAILLFSCIKIFLWSALKIYSQKWGLRKHSELLQTLLKHKNDNINIFLKVYPFRGDWTKMKKKAFPKSYF